jgi:hypothetical protein
MIDINLVGLTEIQLRLSRMPAKVEAAVSKD